MATTHRAKRAEEKVNGLEKNRLLEQTLRGEERWETESRRLLAELER